MGYYQLHGQNPFGWLASDHPWLTMLLIAVTCYAFLPPIVTLRKETVGGEVTMRKATWLLVFIIAILIVTVIYYAYRPFQSAVNINLLGPASALFGGWLNTIFAHPIWKAYFAPTRWAAGWGAFGMLVAVIIALRFVKPQVQKIHIPVIHKTVTPTYTTASTLKASTPVGATVRPESAVTAEEILTEETEEI